MTNRVLLKIHCWLSICLFFFGSGIQAAEPTAQGNKPASWEGKERTLRYSPDGDAFFIKNGNQRFTRAIYGTNTPFRFETSDFPEFGLYMPNFGGSLYMALATQDTAVWVKDLDVVESRFVSGKRTYLLKDTAILGKGFLNITALAMADEDGFLLKTESSNIPEGVRICLIYGGASDKRFSRNGDLGADPADCFYLTPTACRDNQFNLAGTGFELIYGKSKKELRGVFPEGSLLRLSDGNQIDHLRELLNTGPSESPVLVAEYPLHSASPFYAAIYHPSKDSVLSYNQLPDAYSKGEAFRKAVAERVKIQTPDPFINTLGGILSGAEDAIWQSPSYLHGAIGWRTPLTGWRGAYVADVLGLHDRARTHFEAYAASQITDVPVTLPPLQDEATYLARSAKKWGTPMYSNGYITRAPNSTSQMNHYDMNLVYIDELLWHLNWTGDLDYARKVFPVIKRHLAWEKNTFDPDNDGLYDGYCCIWASDGLQYDGGAATHSTAYNYRANKMAANIARLIGEDPTPYQEESDRILKAIDGQLWLKNKGWWAEFKDNMGNKGVHEDAAVWTIYHAIDSDVEDPFMAYEATRYVDTNIPHIPVLAKGLTDSTNYVVSTSDWQPYMWSINTVAFAEIAHTALAYWQAGRGDEAFRLYKGAILDAMYLGSGPGNITQVSFYDAARGEMYRDFADPVGMAARALIHGLFGIEPDLMNGRLMIRPGFPASWKQASLETKDLIYRFERQGNKDVYTLIPTFRRKPEMLLELPVRGDRVSSLTLNGKNISYMLKDRAVAFPKLVVNADMVDTCEIVVEWDGKPVQPEPVSMTVAKGQTYRLDLPGATGEWYDPEAILGRDQRWQNHQLMGTVTGELGHRTLFVRMKQGLMKWWQPIDVTVLPPVECLNQGDDAVLTVKLVNHLQYPLKGRLYVNESSKSVPVSLEGGGSRLFRFGKDMERFGTNRLNLQTSDTTYQFDAINWNVQNQAGTRYEPVDLSGLFNERLRNIYAYGKYLSPRWPYTTLQVPTQGMGQWTNPKALSIIDDKGLSAKAGVEGRFVLPQGIPFATPGDTLSKNIILTTLWDNYPDEVTIPVSGNASSVYFMVAASTYYMQSHFVNGLFTVTYQDSTKDTLKLVLPDNLLPLDQDIFIDGYAFRCATPRPYRIRLKTGTVSKNHAEALGLTMSNDPLIVDGGMATVLDMPLNKQKKLSSISLKTTANEVIIGLMAATLVR
ncbi:MAG: DUF4450 domain-containing protein [Bacteroidota bacterium]|nr:DUF4450 domain-containing protein [Bacteroidota bacterium]